MAEQDTEKTVGGLKDRWEAYDWSVGRRRLAFAAVCAVICALANAVLCLTVAWAGDLWRGHRWLTLLLPVLTAASVLLYDRLGLTYHFRPGYAGLARSMEDDARVLARTGPAMLAGTLLTLLGGGSVGPDAAAKHLGASVGNAILPWFSLPDEKDVPAKRFATACGLAACFSALLCSPLGIFAYTVEHLRANKIVVRHLPTILVSCLIAAALARPAGLQIQTPFVGARAFSAGDAWGAVVVALFCGVFGTAFLVAVGAFQRVRERFSLGAYKSVVAASIFIAALLLLVPGLDRLGGLGTNLVLPVLEHGEAGWAFLIKLALTAVCLGFAMRGGEVTVMFVVGALMGSSIAVAMGCDPLVTGTLAMAALYGVVLKVPVSAVLVGCEFFGWQFAPWLVPTVAVAWAVALLLKKLLGAVGLAGIEA